MYYLRIWQKRKLGWLILTISLFSILSFSNIGLADNSTPVPMKTITTNSICFNEEDTYRLVGELEKYNDLVKINQQLEIGTAELLKQVNLYQQEVETLKEILKITEIDTEAQINLYKTQLETLEKSHKIKEEALQEDLKQASKPKWSALFGSFGLGVIATAVLILAL